MMVMMKMMRMMRMGMEMKMKMEMEVMDDGRESENGELLIKSSSPSSHQPINARLLNPPPPTGL